MKKHLWVFGLFIAILIMGCAGQQPAQKTYICPDGAEVLNQIDCQVHGAEPQNTLTSKTVTPESIAYCSESPNDHCEGDVRKYSPNCLNSKWIYQSEYCPNGCANGACKTKQCPQTCEDGNPCTNDICGQNTNFGCMNVPLTGPQIGCNSKVNCQQQTCEQGGCVSKRLTSCCGNQECETGEAYANCPTDCEKPVPKIDAKPEICGQEIIFPKTTVYFTIKNYGNDTLLNTKVTAFAYNDKTPFFLIDRATRGASLNETVQIQLGSIPVENQITQQIKMSDGYWGNVRLTITGQDQFGEAYTTTISLTGCETQNDGAWSRFAEITGKLIPIMGGIPV